MMSTTTTTQKETDFIRKIFFKLLIGFIVAGFAKDVAGVIDSFFITKYMDETVQAARGLFFALQMPVETIGEVFIGGIGVVASTMLGQARKKEAVEVIGTCFTIMCILMFVLCGLAEVFISPVCRLAGMGQADPLVLEQLELYASAMIPGVIINLFQRILISVSQLDGSSKLSTVSVAVMGITNIIGDYLCAVVFEGGAFGIAMASTVSYIAGLMVFIPHAFFGKNGILIRFRIKISKDFFNVIKSGTPFTMALFAVCIYIFVLNRTIGLYGGIAGTAAYSMFDAARGCILHPVYSLTLSTPIIVGMLYGEENFSGMKCFYKVLRRYLIIIVPIFSALIILFAPVIANFFTTPETKDLTVFLLRCYAVALPLYGFVFFSRGFYPTIGRVKISYIFNILADCVCPSVCVLSFTALFGFKGLGAAFIASPALYLLVNVIYLLICGQKVKQGKLLSPGGSASFGLTESDVFEAAMDTSDEVISSSTAVSEFCKNRELDTRTASVVALVMEEVGMNIVEHKMVRRNVNALAKVKVKNKKATIVIRDNGKLFNPLFWNNMATSDPLHGSGIRIMIGMSESVAYYSIGGLNELIFIV